MTEILTPTSIDPINSEPEISKSLKFWRSQSSAQPQKRLVWQSPVWLIMLGSIAAHTAFWVFLPNPIRQDLKITTAPKVSTISVVTIPPEVLLRANKRQLTSSLPSLDLSRLNIPQPSYNPSLLPPPLLSVPPQDVSRTSNLMSIPNVSNLQPNIALNNKPINKQTNLNFDPGTSNIKPEITDTPNRPIDNSSKNSSNNLVNTPSPKQPVPQPSTPIDPVTGYSYKASDLITTKKPSAGDNFSSVVTQYGADNVIQRQIAAPDTLVPPDKREPVDWIAIKPQTGMSGSVVFILVVSPDGTVEQEPIVTESTNSKLEQLARATIKGYYNKFQPLGQNKYRLVRIHYKIP